MTNQLAILTQEPEIILNEMQPNSRAKVCILVQSSSDNRYLLLQRRPDEIYPNIWECPGGKLETGETLEDCVLREMEEETGISEVESLKYLFANTFFEEFSGKNVYVFYYKVITNKQPTSTPEHVAANWFSQTQAVEQVPFEGVKYAIYTY